MKFKVLDRVARKNFEEVWTVIGSEVDYENPSNPDNELIQINYVRIANAENEIAIVLEADLTYIYSEKPRNKYDFLKMYILVKDSAPIGLGINACSHVGYLAAKTFDNQISEEWEKCSFKKVTCLVSPEQFDQAIEEIRKVDGEYVLFNEDDWNNQDISVAFEPRYSFPEIFKTFKLHSGVV